MFVYNSTICCLVILLVDFPEDNFQILDLLFFYNSNSKRKVSQVFKMEVYRVSQEEWTKLRESVPYVKLYRYNPKHLYPKLNGY